MDAYLEKIEINQSLLMQEAKNDLSGRWGIGVAAYLIYIAIVVVISFIPFASVLVGGAFSLSLAMLSLRFAKREHAEAGMIFDGFKHFGEAIGTYILMMLGVGFAMILLIVPGIILSLGWSMTFYILAEDPKFGIVESLKHSWHLTDGYKWDIFVLGLRFIPWSILCLFTLGIGYLWLMPYMQTTFAKYYLKLKKLKGYGEDEIDDISKHLVT